MSTASDDALQSIFNVSTEQRTTIDKAYENESGYVRNKQIIDIREARANSAEREKILTKDIQSFAHLIHKKKKNLDFSVEFEKTYQQIMHEKEQLLTVIPAKLEKKLEVLSRDYSKELTRVITTNKTMKEENSKALGIAGNRMKMRKIYDTHYGKTAADYNYSQLHDAIHTSRTIDTTACNPYVMDF